MPCLWESRRGRATILSSIFKTASAAAGSDIRPAKVVIRAKRSSESLSRPTLLALTDSPAGELLWKPDVLPDQQENSSYQNQQCGNAECDHPQSAPSSGRCFLL